MDYLKFVITTLIVLGVMAVSTHLSGIGVGTFVMVGGIWGYMIKYRPATHSIAFTIWVLLIVLWHYVVQAAVHLNELADPQKYTADHKAIAIGFGIAIGMIFFHPISYGLSRLSIFLWNKVKNSQMTNRKNKIL